MNHKKTIEKLKKLSNKIAGLEIVILYGSYGRKNANANSDLDIKLVINENFKITNFIELLESNFSKSLRLVKHIALRRKIVIYFNNLPKVEFGICNKLEDVKTHFIGSEISDLEDVILYEKNPLKTKASIYLKSIVDTKPKKIINETYINDLIDKFIYEFESCSVKHKRSDGYHFYFFHNVALHVVVQLNYLATGKRSSHFFPKNFITELGPEKSKEIYNANGTLFLPDGNKTKRALLDFFYTSIKNLISNNRLEELKELCEWIYQRDFFWNFRDASKYNTKIKKGFIHRTSLLAHYQKSPELKKFLNTQNIKTIIDLRADREMLDTPYSNEIIRKTKYINAQFDPWAQPEWFKKTHNHGTNHEIAYRFFIMGCKTSVKKVFEAILTHKEGSIAVHCHAGKDRTGIIFAMIHLLLESSIDNLYVDYFASEMDMKKEKIDIVLDYIKEQGGIESYLLSCNLSKPQIRTLKEKLSNEN